MTRDPVTEEVRTIRDELAKLHGYNIGAIVRALQKASVDEGRQIVSFPPRPLAEKNDGRESEP